MNSSTTTPPPLTPPLEKSPARHSSPSGPVPAVRGGWGWVVTFAGLGINLALGAIYSWSVISKGIPADWGWSQTDKSLPYAVAVLMFCLMMVPGGRIQDRLGPRVSGTLGGMLVGLGLLLCSMSTSPWGYVTGYGILLGAGIGFGYASALPPAIKWFPAARTGLIAGLVVSGFGLASVYAAPLSKWLIASYGLPNTMMILGIGFLLVVMGLAQLLTPPPPGYIPAGTPAPTPGAATRKVDYTPAQMLRTWQFYVLWFMYACGAGAGLMIISKLAVIIEVQVGLALGSTLVAVLALGNGGGRILAGILSDRIGRQATLVLCFLIQAATIFLLSHVGPGSMLAHPAVLAVISALIGANFGANLALFPALTKDYFGLKDFGTNYGLVFTAFGFGGFLLSLLAGRVYDQTQSFNFAYYCSSGLLVAAALITFALRAPRARAAEAH